MIIHQRTGPAEKQETALPLAGVSIKLASPPCAVPDGDNFPDELNFNEASPAQRLVPLFVWLAAVVTLLLIPLKIVSYGFLPGDDSLRHAAKAVSGRDWSDVLVVQEKFSMDHNPGWHWVLGQIHQATGAGTDTLVTVSVAGLLLAFVLGPLAWFRRPEAWIATLLIGMVIFPATLLRITLGRPYVLTAAAVVVILLLWRKQEKLSPAMLGVTTALMALSSWIHGSWYLFALLVAAFGLARQWRSALALSGCWLAGSFLGALLTGHPLAFLSNAINIAISCFGQHQLQRMLVTEFRPGDGAPFAVMLVAAMLMVRALTGTWSWRVVDNPVFLLVVLGWMLGLRVSRFWDDWGLPALTVWIALELQDHLRRYLEGHAMRRLVIAGGLCLSLFFVFTSDLGGRWTSNLTNEYLTESDPEMDPWLPEDGGILYSADMSVFYQTYFKNPSAKWKYILGFESTFMPPDDLQIYRNIQWNYYSHKGYEPWVAKMQPADRLVIKSTSMSPPSLEGLEWKYVARQTWVGRLRKPAALAVQPH